jgi:phosphate transport system protein
MYEAAVDSLRYSDTGKLSVDVYELDQKINAFERDVRKKVMTHLAVTGSLDLAPGLVLVSVVIDIERIGDYTKNICDLAPLHPGRLHGGSQEEELKNIEIRVTTLFRDMIQAFKTSNEKSAREIMETYKGGISRQCDGITNRIVSGEVTDLKSGDGAAVALYSRYLKRIAAHSRNIITSVVNPFDRIGYKYQESSKQS